MKKGVPSTVMQDQELRQECSALWGGSKNASTGVAFRSTPEVTGAMNLSFNLDQPWPLTEEEEAMFHGLGVGFGDLTPRH
jgi:hypothetical protein